MQNDGLQHFSDTWYGTTFQIAVVHENATFSSSIVIYPDYENQEKAKYLNFKLNAFNLKMEATIFGLTCPVEYF